MVWRDCYGSCQWWKPPALLVFSREPRSEVQLGADKSGRGQVKKESCSRPYDRRTYLAGSGLKFCEGLFILSWCLKVWFGGEAGPGVPDSQCRLEPGPQPRNPNPAESFVRFSSCFL